MWLVSRTLKLGDTLGESVGNAPGLRMGVSFGFELLFERGYEFIAVPFATSPKRTK